MSQLSLTTDGSFIFKCSFEEKDIAKNNGFRWDSLGRVWYTRSGITAARLREFADKPLRDKLKKFVIDIEPWISPLVLPPESSGLQLMPHQEEAIRFALSRNKSYLGLDPGLGKTICAAIIAATLSDYKCAYICPPFLVENTTNEFKKWGPKIPIHIVPDSMIIKDPIFCHLEYYKRLTKTILFIDEAHRFKNDDAKRTKALFGTRAEKGIVDFFSKVVLMSGTPMPNRPMELFAMLSKLAPDTIDNMNKFEYGRKFCSGHQNTFGWDFSGASNMPELRDRVIHPKGSFMLRQKKELLNLPPKLEEIFVVSELMPPQLAKMDSNIGERYASIDDLVKENLADEAGKDIDELHLATYRRLLGETKVPSAVEFVKSIMNETDESILIFAHHKKVVADLASELEDFKPLVITGDTPVKERQNIVEMFQSSKEHRIFIGNYQAAGVGFTLTKATRVLFVEFSWTPGENQQASDRSHRIGQQESVLVQYMVFKDSIDKAVIEAILRKQKAINYV